MVRPTRANIIHIVRSHAGKIQTSLDTEKRKTCIMFSSTEAFFRNRKNHFAIACNARRRVVHMRVINPQADQLALRGASVLKRTSRSPGDASQVLRWSARGLLQFASFVLDFVLIHQVRGESRKQIPPRFRRNKLDLQIPTEELMGVETTGSPARK